MVWWSFLKVLACMVPCRFAIGTLYVGSTDDYSVRTPFTPSQVWAEFDTACGVGVCNGERDGFDVKIVDGGFVISATLNSESRQIKWFAIS